MEEFISTFEGEVKDGKVGRCCLGAGIDRCARTLMEDATPWAETLQACMPDCHGRRYSRA